ncbi:hypothetical protein Fcan01_18863, partial [Folsomia candida]
TTDKEGHGPVGTSISDLFEKYCPSSAKLEPWILRSKFDFASYKEFYERIEDIPEKVFYWFPTGVFQYHGWFYYLIDNTTKLEDGDFETYCKATSCRMPDPEKDGNLRLCLHMQSFRRPRSVVDHRPIGRKINQSQSFEKALAAENEEANQFTELARTHSGRIVVAKRQRSYPGAKQLCMDFGMRVIAWNELKFKNGNVEELYLKYRRTQRT